MGYYSDLNSYYKQRKTTAFWSSIRRRQQTKVNSALKTDEMGQYYENIMQAQSEELTPQQQYITDTVSERVATCLSTRYSESVTASDVSSVLLKLSRNSSPGIDGVCAEHLLYGSSPALCSALAAIYSVILSDNIVPGVFETGIIIPIIKKPSLNPNKPENYRPITLGSTYAKIAELLIYPSFTPCATQYGFRQGRSTTHGCLLLHDTIRYMNHGQSPVYICTLDAAKCFDSIWHEGLFYKLYDVIPQPHWILLYRWYKALRARVCWKGSMSAEFKISKGVRQGSIISPQLFNVFIDKLLEKLKSSEDGVRIGNLSINSFAYADDLTLMCATVPGLQRLVDTCQIYAETWRFKFSPAKSKCMVAGKNPWQSHPTWSLYGHHMESATSLDILGVVYSRDGSCQPHITKRTQNCRKAFYSLSDIGLSYPGLAPDVKAYLWRTVCSPSLLYGCDALYIPETAAKSMESSQGSLVKQSVGVGKRSHHNALLKALGISTVSESLRKQTLAIYNRIMCYDSPARDLTVYLIGQYMSTHRIVPGTIVSRVLNLNVSVLTCAFTKYNNKSCSVPDGADGLVDSLRSLLRHEHFLKPYSDEHTLIRLLTRAF